MNSERLFKAIQYAARAHEKQKRKGNNPAPYITHPFFVGMELIRLGCDENTVIAGILHDTLEDTFLSKEIIEKEFGAEVLNLIEAVTEPKNLNMTKVEKRRTWQFRKEAYLEQLKVASAESKAIACVDMLANMLEFKHTLKDLGADALKLFNVDIESKLRHWQEEIDLLAKDKNCPYLKIIPDLRNMLMELHNSRV